MLVISAGYIGEVIQGDTVRFVFNTVDATGVPTTVTGGALEHVNLRSAVASTAGLTVSWDETHTGRHVAVLDSTGLGFGDDYVIQFSAGTVGATSVVGVHVGQTTISGKAAGRTYEQAVKVIAGNTTASTGQNRTFGISGADIVDDVDDYYARQVLTFQPGSQNPNIGRVILKSVGNGDGTQTVTVQEFFPAAIQDGDPFVILPEERELTIYTANITLEFGLSTSEGDQYSVQWFADGDPLQNPGSVITLMGLEVYNWSDDALVFSETYPGNLTFGANTGLYKYVSSVGDSCPTSEGRIMIATAEIDAIPYQHSRTLFNYV